MLSDDFKTARAFDEDGHELEAQIRIRFMTGIDKTEIVVMGPETSYYDGVTLKVPQRAVMLQLIIDGLVAA